MQIVKTVFLEFSQVFACQPNKPHRWTMYDLSVMLAHCCKFSKNVVTSVHAPQWESEAFYAKNGKLYELAVFDSSRYVLTINGIF